MISIRYSTKYCSEDISKIQNYNKAIADKSNIWLIHHKAEILPCGRFTKKDLVKFQLYYKRPANELMFLTRAEHAKLHHTGMKRSYSTKHKISAAVKGIKHSEEARKKMSLSHTGKSTSRKGKHLSAEWKQKISNSISGTHWYNNGTIQLQAKQCPVGFKAGRLKQR